MEGFLRIAYFLFIFIGIPVGIIYLTYYISIRFGFPKIAKYLTLTISLVLIAGALFLIFQDQFFTKANAKELIAEQGITLTNKFSLQDNKSMSAFGDYYHTFTLIISEQDKIEAIRNIKSSENFTSDEKSVEDLEYKKENRYFGEKIIQNYETEKSFVREYFKPSGEENYAPTFRRISIDKLSNKLIFEDLNE